MKEEKKHIDRLFQEKFKDFEASPSDNVWNNIEKSLQNKKEKKRRVIPIWWRLGGVAAILALLFSLGYKVFLSIPDFIDTPVVNDTPKNKFENTTITSKNSSITTKTNNVTQHSEKSIPTITSTNLDKQNIESNSLSNTTKTTPNTSKHLKPIIKLNNQNTNNKTTQITSHITKSKTNQNPTNLNKGNSLVNKISNKRISNLTKLIKSGIAVHQIETGDLTNNLYEGFNKLPNTTKFDTLLGNKKQSVFDAIAQQNNTVAPEKNIKNQQTKWSIKPNIAPVYFGSLGEGSSIDNQFNQNDKTSDITMSYGIVGSYKISNRLKVRAGVNRVNLNQTTSQVYAFEGIASFIGGTNNQLSNINYNNQSQNISLLSLQGVNNPSSFSFFRTTAESSNIEQRMGFIELPVEMEYKVLDKKLGLNLIGGFSSLFLNNNEIYIDMDGETKMIGEANNINTTSFTANFGLGIDYSLSKSIQLSVEPTFKYQMNTFNNTSGNFSPFFMGVYSGLSLKF